MPMGRSKKKKAAPVQEARQKAPPQPAAVSLSAAVLAVVAANPDFGLKRVMLALGSPFLPFRT